ncbi:hypothetical protein [Streptomyces broussonetiae]|uniref:Pyridoxal-phosphate dependent enzyme n=1 Tax=Streptomyces broussonetiae TaxID=2686304 RepID=A0ABV5EAK8_9ACTN
MAVGSGGTMAGLLPTLGADRVLGVRCGAVTDPAGVVAALLSGLSGTAPAPERLRLRLDQVGEGYGAPTEPVVTGLIAAVEDGHITRGRRTVFLHTGGPPGLFGHRAALEEAASDLATRSRSLRDRGSTERADPAAPRRHGGVDPLSHDASRIRGGRPARPLSSSGQDACRCGSRQPGRGKWQVYPSG